MQNKTIKLKNKFISQYARIVSKSDNQLDRIQSNLPSMNQLWNKCLYISLYWFGHNEAHNIKSVLMPELLLRLYTKEMLHTKNHEDIRPANKKARKKNHYLKNI